MRGRGLNSNSTFPNFRIPEDKRYSRAHNVRFFLVSSYSLTHLSKKNYVPFFRAKMRAFGGHFENFYSKRINR